MKRAIFRQLAVLVGLVFFSAGILRAAPVTTSGTNIQDNTIPPAKLQRTGSAPTDNQVPAYDNATGRFRWIAGGGSATPAGSSGQIQYQDGGALGAIPGLGYNSADNSVTFPGSIVSSDPGNGLRRIMLLSNTSYTCSANENSVLVFNGGIQFCENGVRTRPSVTSALLTVTDNFNRSDENPLGNGVWTTGGTGFVAMQITSNYARDTSNGASNLSYYTGSTFSENHYAQSEITMKAAAETGYIGLVCRWNNRSGYKLTVQRDSSYGAISRVDNATDTVLGSTFAFPVGTGTHTHRLECNGTSIIYKANGSVVATRTDNTYSSGYPGIHQYDQGVNGTYHDNFQAGDL